MRRSRHPLVLAVLTLPALPLAVPSPTVAQVPGVVGLEVRAGAAVGSYAPTRAGLQMAPAPAWGVWVSWGPSRAIGAYASYASVGFGCEEGFCRGYDVSFASRGVGLGVRAEAPLPGAPWVRAGLLLHELEQSWGGTSPPGSATADTGAGFETAVGLNWRVGPRLELGPSLHLGFLPTRGEDGVTDRAFFAGLDLGVRLVLDSRPRPI
jgi:hypothetical protein